MDIDSAADTDIAVDTDNAPPTLWRHPQITPPIPPQIAGLSFTAVAPDFLVTPLAQHFAACVARQPNAVAVVSGSGHVTYAALAAHSARLAARIDARTPRDAAVAVIAPRSAAGLAAILACSMAQRVCVILENSHPDERIAEILGDAKPAAVIADPARLAGMLPDGVLNLALDIPASAAELEFMPPPALGPDDPAFVIYTSGSTGRPKGIVASQRALLCRALGLIEPCRMNATDSMLATTPPSAMSGLSFALAALLVGARQCAFDLVTAGANAFLQIAARERLTILIASPPLMRTLLAVPGAKPALALVRVVRSAADVLLRSDVDQFREILPPGCLIATTYASTEAMMAAHWFIPPEFKNEGERLPAGYMRADHEFALEAADGRLAAPGEPGELIVRSAHIALGEWRDGACVAGRLHADPDDPGLRIYRTGDIATLGADGLLRLVGRADRQIKIRGLRVEPTEIEAAMRAAPGVADAAVVALQDGEAWTLHGFVVPMPDAPAAELGQTTRSHLVRALVPAMVPPRIFVVPAIPRFPIGKVDQQRLLALMPDVPAMTPQRAAASSPETEVSEQVRQAMDRAWSRTLDRQSLADDMPFDEAGGDSLRFLILVYHMEELLGITLPLDLFELSMSPSAIAAAVQRHLSGDTARTGERPPIFLLPGIGGDEPRLVRFREACAGAFRIVPVGYGDWREWVRPDFDLDKLLGQVAADIAAQAPSGPLMLAGYSLGGFMAYAVAARLAEAGRTIAAIGLLDATNIGAAAGAPGPRQYDRNEELQQIVAGFKSGTTANVLARSVVRRLTSPRWQRFLPAAIRLSDARLPGDFGYYLRGHLRIGLLTKFIQTHRANFIPNPALSQVPLMLFRSDAHAPDNNDLGWAGYGRSLATVSVIGDHFNMFDPPNLQILADQFIDAMQSGAD